jgi:hypothetical protein
MLIDHLQSLRLVGISRRGWTWTLLEYAAVWAAAGIILYLVRELV